MIREGFIIIGNRKLVSAVNSKTDYLVVGHILDDGRQVTEGKKYKNAVKYGKKILNEKEFEQFCRIRF